MNTSFSTAKRSFNLDSQSNLALLKGPDDSSKSNWKLQRAIPEGQLKIHSSPFRGSFPGVLSEALRAAGLGSQVMVAQFLKGGVDQGPEGLVKLCDRLEWIRPAISACIHSKLSETILSEEKNNDLQAVKEVWEICKNRLLQGEIDQLVLEEVGLAISLGYLDESELISTLEQRPPSVDVILTGPDISPNVMAMADQVTVLRSGL